MSRSNRQFNANVFFGVLTLTACLAGLAVQLAQRKTSREIEASRSLKIQELLDCQKKSDTEVQIKLDKVLSGAAPDYEDAKKTADAMNSFNEGLRNIMSYNSMQVQKKRQNQPED